MSIRLPILIFFSLLITSCSTTRIDQEVNAAYSIKDGESIVVLSDSYHTGNKTENDFRAIFTSFFKLQNYVFSSKVSLCKMLWISEKDAHSWDFLELNFSPTIYPPIICLKRLFSATCQKIKIPDNVWLSGICLIFLLFSVIRLGLSP